ncbi:MAG: glycerophosphodiester phosphodiesterase [Actinomycetes bacterium]
MNSLRLPHRPTRPAPLRAWSAGLRVGPVVIAHRGASGYRPEHTLAAFALAIRLGADFIEPDLVLTRDGVLIVRHDNEISATTDVADRPEFAGRRTTREVDGRTLTGWFTEDFTLAEIKTLRARERLPWLRPTCHDGRFEVATFQEVLDLARSASRRFGRTIGVYPETKHPTYFSSLGLSHEEPLVRALRSNGLDRVSAPVLVQSMETGNLARLADLTRVGLVQLLAAEGAPYDLAGLGTTYADLATPAGLAGIADYAVGIGVAKDLVVPRSEDGRLLAPTTLVADAHERGLFVHGYTFRAENAFLPAGFRGIGSAAEQGDGAAECATFLELGLDGMFADHPDVAVAGRARAARRAALAA